MYNKTKENEDLAYFDCLPDAILLLIFNKLHHLKSLTKCLSVSKRFLSLIPLIDTVFISIPHRKHLPKPNTTLRNVFLILFLKPLRCFNRIMSSSPKSTTMSFDFSSCKQNGVLKIFKEIKSLHLELPFNGEHGELGSSNNGACFLQWKAVYGSNLKTCIIVGAKSFSKCKEFPSKEEREDQFMEETVLLNDDELKLRVIWTISCLISASTRHYLLNQILADDDNPMLQKVVISDANKRGLFCMGKRELVEMRKSINTKQESSSSAPPPAAAAMERSQVPELNMKLWYLPMLELPDSGYVMKGATLVIIKPVADGMIENNSGDPLMGDETLFSEVVREMIKVKKSYLMTMSSF